MIQSQRVGVDRAEVEVGHLVPPFLGLDLYGDDKQVVANQTLALGETRSERLSQESLVGGHDDHSLAVPTASSEVGQLDHRVTLSLHLDLQSQAGESASLLDPLQSSSLTREVAPPQRSDHCYASRVNGEVSRQVGDVAIFDSASTGRELGPGDDKSDEGGGGQCGVEEEPDLPEGRLGLLLEDLPLSELLLLGLPPHRQLMGG